MRPAEFVQATASRLVFSHRALRTSTDRQAVGRGPGRMARETPHRSGMNGQGVADVREDEARLRDQPDGMDVVTEGVESGFVDLGLPGIAGTGPTIDPFGGGPCVGRLSLVRRAGEKRLRPRADRLRSTSPTWLSSPGRR